jgi:putative membrane protein
MKRLTWCAGWALLGAASLALAAPPGAAPKPGDAPAVSDEDFVRQASAAGLAEVNLGRLAAEQATSPDVKKFAQQMVEDHSKANEALNKVADNARITPSPAMDAKHHETYQKLAGMRGADFDRAYVESQLADHKDAVALFEAESKGGKNDDLKALAGKTLPTLQHHLDMVQKLASAEKPPDKDKPAPAKDKETIPAPKDKEANPPVKDKETVPPPKDKEANPPLKDKAPPAKDIVPPPKDKDANPPAKDKETKDK